MDLSSSQVDNLFGTYRTPTPYVRQTAKQNSPPHTVRWVIVVCGGETKIPHLIGEGFRSRVLPTTFGVRQSIHYQ